MDKLFTYGTLKRDGRFHYSIEKEIQLINDDCYMRGVLISLGEYPAAIDGIGKVWGELFSITEKGLQICHKIEGYEPGKDIVYYPVHKTVYELDGFCLAKDAIVYIINPLNVDFCWIKCKLEVGIN